MVQHRANGGGVTAEGLGRRLSHGGVIALAAGSAFVGAALFASGEASAQVVVVGGAPYGAQPAPSGGLQTLWLRPGFAPDPMTLSGMATGVVPASSLGPGCSGMAPSAPQQQLWVGAAMPWLRVFVRASAGVTVAVRAPSGAVFCTEGAPGREATLELRSVQPGTYFVSVGTVGNAVGSLPYTLVATTLPQVTPAMIAMPAGLTQGAPWAAQPVTAPRAVVAPQAAGGESTATVAAGGVPTGWVRIGASGAAPRAPRAPSVAVNAPVNAAVNAPVSVPVNAPVNSAVNSAVNSGIVIAPGAADVQRASGSATGRVSLRFLGRQCLGFGARAPSARFAVREGVPFLRAFVRSVGDSTIAVRAPNGVLYCADDTFGVHPSVDVAQPVAGEWQVFVGTYAPRVTLPFELTVSTRADVQPAADGAAQSPSAAPNGSPNAPPGDAHVVFGTPILH